MGRCRQPSIKLSIVFIIISAVFYLSTYTIVEGRVIVVPDDATTVQAGLNVIESGDTLFIRIGFYEEVLFAPPLLFSMIGEFSPDSGEMDRPLIDVTQLNIFDSIPVLLLPDSSQATIANIHFKNRERAGIVCTGTEVSLTNCIIDSTRLGFEFPFPDMGASVTIRDCQFSGSYRYCVFVPRGNTLNASGCTFTSSASDNGRALVSAGEPIIDSCHFSSGNPTVLLYCFQGPIVITNCTFGPVTTPFSEYAVQLRGGAIEFRNNDFVDCTFSFRAMDVQSTVGDSVEICDNRFTRCHGHTPITSQGVISVLSEGETQRGALICGNVFTDCWSMFAVDDIYLYTNGTPALLEGNMFIRDSINGLPSIYAGVPWQPAPATLRNNVFENCGYALDGPAAVDAQFNYWGDSSGPYHEFDNPNGRGDTITGGASFIPWLEDTTTTIGGSRHEIAGDFTLGVFPNPFNAFVTIEYALTKEQNVHLEIYDVLGRQVETLFDETQSIGVHQELWNAEGQASGIYFARLSSAESKQETQAVKLLLMK